MTEASLGVEFLDCTGFAWQKGLRCAFSAPFVIATVIVVNAARDRRPR